ncbi:anthranilate synthase component I [Candidatus Spongiisocius sp.]|uniref:anthranilate synthase component I n=1 Tax=Candidatus Spongiisocius sp. TaxID=3101273 RepID=UPI003B5AD5D9
MKVTPSPAGFRRLAEHASVVPIRMALLSDRETPVSAFGKLVGHSPGFLLESLEGGERWARWSFLGWDPIFTLTSRDGVSHIDHPRVRLPEGDPLTVLERLLARYAMDPMDDLPPLHSGAVGYLSYDAVRYIERLPDQPQDDRGLPEMMWQFVGSLAALDHPGQTLHLVRNVFTDLEEDLDAAYQDAVTRLHDAADRLGTALRYRPAAGLDHSARPDLPAASTLDREDFERAVLKVKDYIREGDAYQVVLSRRIGTPFEGDPFDLYRALRLINPSPFLFYLRHPDLTVAGSSPELMTRVRDGTVFSRPIAGTRRRGASPEEDRALEKEMLADPKERAEHVMLIDLARNDLGRVCDFGTVTVDDLMVVERYSHVMHLVSGVSGRLRDGLGPVDVVRAVFPHGTVSGAPKVRAMEIIDEIEPVARGPYAGAAGYMDFSGNVDTAICLRTVVIAGGTAWVQAGAGLVADSDPETEFQETEDKAAAALAAVAGAELL